MVNETYEILRAHDESSTIEVIFYNPYHDGDEGSNPHATKTILVPLTESGEIDHEGLTLILEQQMMGVRHRMDTAYKQSQTTKVSLSDAFGVPSAAVVPPSPLVVPEPEPATTKK